jgi:hypothetical protein
LRLDVAASAWDPDLIRVNLDIAGTAHWLVVGRHDGSHRVQRQAEPSASREVLIPYSVRQPRCALSGAAGTRTIPLRRSRRSHPNVTDVRFSDQTLALAVLRSALATRLTSCSVNLRIPPDAVRAGHASRPFLLRDVPLPVPDVVTRPDAPLRPAALMGFVTLRSVAPARQALDHF